MRVIAGTHKGRPFAAPSGRDTRPTTDRVREAIFSAVISELDTLEEVRVCDAFAGSGAFGIESISRGAEHVAFFERDKKTALLVKNNLKTLDMDNKGAVSSCDTLKSPSIVAGQGPYNLLFLDPPYKISSGEIANFLMHLRDAGALSNRAMVVYEHAAHTEVEPIAAEFSVIKEKKYGDTLVSYFRYNEASV